MKQPSIKYLFEPRGVAVIGASRNKNKIGYKLVQNIVSGKFNGRIYPVNPKGGRILGLKIYKTVNEIEGIIDLACIAIPAEFVFDAVKECAKKGVKFLVVITSGFSEIGNIKEEHEIVSFAREHGMRVLGPNIFGIYSRNSMLNATFGQKDINPGNVAIITQSGALGIAMMGRTKTENIGLSAMVSVGNKSDIDESDLLEYLVSNRETRVVMIYIEGVKNGERFVRVMKESTKKKPVVVIKAGKSKRGAMAAASHTGSLAGADEIFSDIMKQCGVMRAETVNQAFDWCKFLAASPLPKGENTVIITNGGGIGVMAADACEKYNVTLYDDFEVMRKIFADSVPSFGSVKNPIDITGQATAAEYERALDVALHNKKIHSIICLGCETAVLNSDELSTTIDNFVNKNKGKKPFIFSFIGGPSFQKVIDGLKHEGIPVFSNVDDAISCFGAMYADYKNKKLKTTLSNYLGPEELGMNLNRIKKIINSVKRDNRAFFMSHEAQELMRAACIDVPKLYIATSMKEAAEYAEKIGYPVVLKVVSKDIIHKSDVGGVILSLGNKNEVLDAYEVIVHNCKRNMPNAKIEGIEISEMISSGSEVILGARRDNSFGPIVMFGLGGVYVEVMKDVAFRAFPLRKREAWDMIKETKTYRLLLGVRGENRKDIKSVVYTLLKLGIIVKTFKEISDIEINPLKVFDKGDYKKGEGVNAVDVRILLSNPVRG
ncbi:acetate--CoA ligase family protein [Candidatus Woesearchaeota archaeon]|nr:acetate--CoA ligase family protein [Candidatus Woesearchaeota archaeon]